VLLGYSRFKDSVCFPNIPKLLLHTKCLAVAHLRKGNFSRAIENWVKFLILQEGTLKLILSIKENQTLDPGKNINKKERPSEAFQHVNYVTLEAQVHKHCYKECEEKNE
jgi:hypothetical protein